MDFSKSMIKKNSHFGFSLVEAIIVAAVSTMVFGALFGSVRFALDLVASAQARLSAVSLANDRMESIRALSYNSVGTISGFPAGPIPQTSTTSLNSIEFYERVVIDYIDDPADGLGAADSNFIITDYKRVKVEYSWSLRGATSTIFLTSNISPRSIETNVGGGAVRINVRDAASLPLAGIPVQLTNTTGTTTYYSFRFTNSSGEALFVAPAAADYNVVVGGSLGYSEERTYAPTAIVPIPDRPPFAVLEADVSTLFFQIDQLSDITFVLKDDHTWDYYHESFASTAGISSSTNITIDSGRLTLDDGGTGTYAPVGIAYLTPLTPSGGLVRWEQIIVAPEVVTDTDYTIQVFTGSDPYVLVPDTELSGNSTGFSGKIIDIGELDVTTFPAIVIGITLSTTNTSITPQIDDIGVSYSVTESYVGGESLFIRNAKTIGQDASSTPIYKFSATTTTNTDGESSLTDVEWGEYSVTVPAGYDLAAACPDYPWTVAPGDDDRVVLTLAPDQVDTLRVRVENEFGQPQPGSALTLSRPGYLATATTSPCGQAFFSGGGLVAQPDYELLVQTPGYPTQTISAIDITGDRIQRVILNP